MDLPLSQKQLDIATAYAAKIAVPPDPPLLNTVLITNQVYATIFGWKNDLRNDFLAQFMSRFQTLSPADRILVDTFMRTKPVDPTEV
jgi:hypothetical protein